MNFVWNQSTLEGLIFAHGSGSSRRWLYLVLELKDDSFEVVWKDLLTPGKDQPYTAVLRQNSLNAKMVNFEISAQADPEGNSGPFSTLA